MGTLQDALLKAKQVSREQYDAHAKAETAHAEEVSADVVSRFQDADLGRLRGRLASSVGDSSAFQKHVYYLLRNRPEEIEYVLGLVAKLRKRTGDEELAVKLEQLAEHPTDEESAWRESLRIALGRKQKGKRR